MHNVTRRSHQMQKHMFSVTCLDAPFIESIPVPHEHENQCDHVSRPGRTGMHYVTLTSDRMQKHKLGVTCPGAFFMETTPGPLELENASTFCAPDAPKCTT
jgi:hypothetical protein